MTATCGRLAAVGRCPGGDLARRFQDRAPADLDDGAGILGQRDEIDRRDQAAGRVTPAQQRLIAVHAVVLDVDDRLVEELELAALGDGAAQIGLEVEALDRGRVHRRLERLGLVAAGGLRLVERQVGVPQQLVTALAGGLRGEHVADAGRHLELAALDRDRMRHGPCRVAPSSCSS